MLFIGICGASGSGKTTLARELVRDMGVKSVVLNQDAYYLDHPDLSFQERVKLNYDEPCIFDHDLLYEDVCRLLRGECITRKGYDFSQHRRADTSEVIDPGKARVLIVDDTKMNLIVATGFLKDTGISIDTAGGGKEAVILAHENAYDVILMDQRMPEMDGVQTLQEIRKDKNGPNLRTPIICLTADAVVGARDRYLSKGFQDYLTKPIDSVYLEAMQIGRAHV